MGYKGPLPATFYGAGDANLDEGPGIIYWLVIQPSSTNWVLYLRDGSDSGAEIILALGQQANRARLFRFNPPLPYERGLFVHLSANITSFTIAYDHLET